MVALSSRSKLMPELVALFWWTSAELTFLPSWSRLTPEIAFIHKGPKESVGCVLGEIVCVCIVEYDVAVTRKELPATFANLFKKLEPADLVAWFFSDLI